MRHIRVARTQLILLAIAGLVISAALLAGGRPAGAIVNGSAVSISDAPWQVSLQYQDYGYFCGGSILDDTTVVTAAHCVDWIDSGGLFVRAGVADSTSGTGQDVAAKSITWWPDYAATQVGDIAIIILEEPLTFSATVQPIPIASAQEISAVTVATTTGWGRMSSDGSDSPQQLRTTTIPLIGDSACIVSGTDIDRDGEMCAGGQGSGPCYGDSGGPLSVATASGPKLAGIVSWGMVCADTPAVFAEVLNYMNFIATAAANPSITFESDPPVLVDVAAPWNPNTGFVRYDEVPFFLTVDATSTDVAEVGIVLEARDGTLSYGYELATYTLTDRIDFSTMVRDVPGTGSFDLEAVVLVDHSGNSSVYWANGDLDIEAGSETIFDSHAIDFSAFTITMTEKLCGGLMPTVVLEDWDWATEGDDVILGTPEYDFIEGYGGNDVICGLGDSDEIYGGAGADVIRGGSGPDVIWGGNGNDRILGGPGADEIHGESGADRLIGSNGADHLYGGQGKDNLLGGRGNDQIDGGDGNDRVGGGTGGDTVLGLAGRDRVFGGDGGDILRGGDDDDRLFGGGGIDVVHGEGGIDECEGDNLFTCEQ